MTLLEICVDDAAGLDAALAGGADRIELCAALELGGLSPTPGLVALAAKKARSARAMVRPRPGDFVFTQGDMAGMLAEIAAIRASGIEGVVLGANLPDNRLDVEKLAALAKAAEGMGRTLHRCIDLVPDMAEAVETAVALGFDTILTSGGALSAPEGLDALERAHRVAAGRLTIMAGAGVNAVTAPQILARVRLGALHGSCSEPAPEPGGKAQRLGFASPLRRMTSTTRVAALKAAIQAG